MESLQTLGQHERSQRLPDDPLLRDAEHAGKSSVAVKNRSVLAERDGAFLDLLDQHLIRAIGALQRVNSLLFRLATHDQSVDLAAADRAERLLTLP